MAFTDKEFTYGDVTFRVDKLLPQEAKVVFIDHVRPLMEGALSVQTGGRYAGVDNGRYRQSSGGSLLRCYEGVVPARLLHVAGPGAAATVGGRRRTGLCESQHGAFAAGGRARVCCKFLRVLGRTPIGVPLPKPDYSVVTTRNIDPFFANPIEAGLCTLVDLKTRGADGDPILDLADVCVLNDILVTKAVNSERAQKRSEQKAAAQRASGRGRR